MKKRQTDRQRGKLSVDKEEIKAIRHIFILEKYIYESGRFKLVKRVCLIFIVIVCQISREKEEIL